MISARLKAALLVAPFAAATVFATLPARSQYVARPDERLALGAAVPDAWLLDEHGDTLILRDLAGAPLVLSPVFTTCPHACPAITASLIDALEGLEGCGKTFNVLTLSFDPSDTPERLAAYRHKTGIPDEWILATGVPAQVRPIMEAIDFRFEPLAGGGFAHANAVAVLSPDLTVSGYLHGLAYAREDVKAALRRAAGRRPLVDRARPFLLPIAAFFLVATLLVILITARKSRHPA